jgi:large subunit ribosomal protein L25
VLYGHGISSQPLQVEERALRLLLARGGEHNIVSLSIAGTKESHMVLVREIQRDPLKPLVLHVDFYRVVMTEKLQAHVPLVVVGESPAVVDGLGALVQNLDSVEVECLPGDLPSSFEVDISVLERTDQNVTVGDIASPQGVEILDAPETVIISMAIARVLEEEEEEEVEIAVPEPEDVEVVAKGRAAKGIGEEAEEG